MKFDPEIQGMTCKYCGSDKRIKVDHREIEEKELDSIPTFKGWETHVQTFGCESCGATITTKRNITGECPFCGSHYVKELPKHDDLIRPENLIPFIISGREAKDLFRRWMGQGLFRPNDLKKIKKMNKLHGIYVPFWTFDCNTHSEWTAESGYHYWETETYSDYENGKWVTKTRQVQRTRWEYSSGNRNGYYDDILIIASKGLDKGIVREIQPFHLEALVPYQPDFLSGWAAEEYSIDVHSGWKKAREVAMSEEYTKCGRDVPGDTYRGLNVKTDFSKLKFKHILLPIWSASYHYKKKLYHFLINGQTGEIQGERPLSWLKIAIAVAAGAAILGLGILIYLNAG
jgi:hypothetical protein